MTLPQGSMARLIVKDDITLEGALAVGQTLWLGGFIMAAPSAAAPKMASRVINHNLRVSSELAEQMDPMELSSLNELLDRIAALGVTTNYDRIGLKPDQREIRSPPATHEVVIVEEPHADCPSILRTKYVRIAELLEPKICSKDNLPEVPDLGSGIGPKELGSAPDSGLLGSEPPTPLGVRSDHNPDSANNTYLDLNCLSRIRQEPQEMVHHY